VSQGAAPHLFRPMYPDFLRGAPPTAACAAFIKESRMKFASASKSTGNPVYAQANMGHPSGDQGFVFYSNHRADDELHLVSAST
jgi:hypothetical protein